MPLPKTTKVGPTMRHLKKAKPGMSHRQKVAISLGNARKHGASIPKKPSAMAMEVNRRAKKRKRS